MSPDSADRAGVEASLLEFQKRYVRHRKTTFGIFLVTLFAGLAFSVGAFIAGLADEGKLAAGLGLATAAVIALDKGFGAKGKNEFYREITGMTENLIENLRYGGADPKEVLESLHKLRVSAVKALPKSEGLEALKDLQRTPT